MDYIGKDSCEESFDSFTDSQDESMEKLNMLRNLMFKKSSFKNINLKINTARFKGKSKGADCKVENFANRVRSNSPVPRLNLNTPLLMKKKKKKMGLRRQVSPARVFYKEIGRKNILSSRKIHRRVSNSKTPRTIAK